MSSSGSSPIKGERRTRRAIEEIKRVIYDVVAADQPMTVRQVFYQLVSQGAIAKTEGEYKRTVGRLLSDMREDGELPFEWIADNTRWMRKPQTYSSIGHALRHTAERYRRNLWEDQSERVEIWLEKDALAGVIYDVTSNLDVPLMVTRGYPSSSFVHKAALEICEDQKPAHIYYLGDHDPSGLDIQRSTEEKLRRYADDHTWRGFVDITLTKIAVTPEQITEMSLLTRPTKRTDSRSKDFEGESVEVDAIPAGVLRDLVRKSIMQHIDETTITELETIQEEERGGLEQFARSWVPDEGEEVQQEEEPAPETPVTASIPPGPIDEIVKRASKELKKLLSQIDDAQPKKKKKGKKS